MQIPKAASNEHLNFFSPWCVVFFNIIYVVHVWPWPCSAFHGKHAARFSCHMHSCQSLYCYVSTLCWISLKWTSPFIVIMRIHETTNETENYLYGLPVMVKTTLGTNNQLTLGSQAVNLMCHSRTGQSFKLVWHHKPWALWKPLLKRTIMRLVQCKCHLTLFHSSTLYC